MSQPGEVNVKELGLSVKTVDVEKEVVDVAICIDLTGSMEREAVAARNKVISVFDKLKTQYPGKKFRLALVGYRDKHDRKKFDIIDFTEDIEVVKTVLTNIIENGEVEGGDDIPENVAEALSKLHELSWGVDSIKQVLHIADAPPHGNEYHDDNIADDYPDGDEDFDCKELMTLFATKQIGFMFMKMNHTTDTMNTIFRLAYQKGRGPGTKANYILSDMSLQIQQSRSVYAGYDAERSGGYDEFDDDSVTRGGSFHDKVDNTSISDTIFESQLLEAVCSQL